MTISDLQTNYLNSLLNRREFELLVDKSITIVATGSSGDPARVDRFSDWDFKIFVHTDDIQPFQTLHGSRFSISDDKHDPPTFTLVRTFEFVDHEFTQEPVVAMWIYGTARILRDDKNRYNFMMSTRWTAFKEAVERQIEWEYLRLRTYRHGIDGAARRKDIFALKMLTQECIRFSLQLLFLVYGMPYPYLQWLYRVACDEFQSQHPLLFATINTLSSEQELTRVPNLSRELVTNLIEIMATRGHSHEQLEKWWLNI